MELSRHVPSRSPLAAALLSLALAACSGGGGGGDSPPGEPLPPSGETPAGVPGNNAANDDPATVSSTGTGADTDTDADSDMDADADGTEPSATNGDPSAPETCSVADVNGWVDGRMRDFYLYADRVPLVDLAAYDDPDDLVEDLRVPPDTFSNVQDEESQTRRSEEGIRFGFGHWLRYDADDRLRFRRVRANSPTDEAGIERGDVMIEVNGIPVLDVTDEQWDAFYGEPDVPTRMTLLVQRGDEAPRTIEIESGEYFFPTANTARVFTRDGVRVAYLPVEAFYETTRGELDGTVEWLAGRDIDELMIDFRYNQGGRSSVARRMAGQLVGPGFADREFQRRVFNARYAERNEATLLEAVVPALAMPRIVALVSDRTASASESVINGLEPYIDVTVIGETTSGKPFTSYPESYCGKTLNAMNAIRTNAAGVSVAGGIEPDCLVEDEYLHPRRDARDALTAAGLAFLTSGSCPSAALANATRTRAGGTRSPIAGPGDRELDAPADIGD